MLRSARITLFLAWALAWSLLPGCDRHKQDRAEIQMCFEDWDRATAKQDGETAAECVTKATFATFERLRTQALDAKPEQVQSLPPMEQLLIYGVRLHAKRSQIKPMDGRAFYVWCSSQVWNTGAADEFKLKDIKVDGFNATAVLYDPDEEVHPLLESRRERRERRKAEKLMTIRFFKENGSWNMEHAAIAEMYNHILREISAEGGIGMPGLIESIREDELKGRPADFGWKPMK